MSQDKQSQQGMSTWLWLALLATVALTFWTATQEDDARQADELVVVNKRSRPLANHKQQVAKRVVNHDLPENRLIDWEQLAREPSTTPKDLFGRANWSDRKKIAIKQQEIAPPPPMAPPLPFTYMGRMDDGPNGNVIYLADQERSYTVKIGGKVGQQWRLDQEDKNNLQFTYLPLNLTSTLSKQADGAAGFN